MRPQPSSRLSTSGAPPEHFEHTRDNVVAVGSGRSVLLRHLRALRRARVGEGGVRARVPKYLKYEHTPESPTVTVKREHSRSRGIRLRRSRFTHKAW